MLEQGAECLAGLGALSEPELQLRVTQLGLGAGVIGGHGGVFDLNSGLWAISSSSVARASAVLPVANCACASPSIRFGSCAYSPLSACA